MTLYAAGLFTLFLLMLVGLLVFHHQKLYVVLAGFVTMATVFISNASVATFAAHFHDPHREHLLMNLALLLPGFSLVAWYCEHSGLSGAMARKLSRDTLVLWAVFWLSTVLDNIAAAMIGGTILLALYGKGNVPFNMLIGVICASNLGGAGSPVGDTTTVMMFISEDPKVPAAQIFMAFVATIPAQIVICLWATRHTHVPLSIAKTNGDVEAALQAAATLAETDDDALTSPADAEALVEGAHEKRVQWKQVLPLLGVPGLVIGNFVDQPGLGLWAGIIVGLLVGRVKLQWRAAAEAIPNTIFLVTLVGAAEMLPLNDVKGYLEVLSRDDIAVLMGVLSAWFDNIPLTAVCLGLKGFDWGLLAYAVGFGGSAMWFGSSAGVALGLMYREIYDTRRWIKPFFAVTGAYFVGVFSYLIVFRWIVPTLGF